MSLEQLDLYGPWKRNVIDYEGAKKIAELTTFFLISGFYMMGLKGAKR